MPEKILLSCCQARPATELSLARDPVCGMDVDTSKSKPCFDFEGDRYHFCCQSCKDKFEQNPSIYLKLETIDSNTAPSQPANFRLINGKANCFTCPMHPEVVSDRQADCPACGMALDPLYPLQQNNSQELRYIAKQLIWSAAFSFPLLIIAMSSMPSHVDIRLISVWQWLQLLLASPVVLWFAIPFYQKGIASLKNGNLNMFTLLCLGIAIPYAYSLCSLLTNTFITRQLLMNHNVFFESSAVIGTLAWLGQYLEALARVQSSGSLKELMALAPNTATILLPDQSEKTIAISEISAHMKVVVKPGERIPVDGAVISGVSTVDESMLTGEYLPTTKLPGNEVSAGTLNKNGSLTIDTEKVGEDTRLAQIVALVGQAQRSRVPAQQLADKISACFVPLVLAIAAITYFAWLAHGDDISQSVLAGVAVLVVACPCALGLATPMAIVVGAGRAARAGVLFKEARALQALSHANILVLDKTGTLTLGAPSVLSIVAMEGMNPDLLLAMAASIEYKSEHVLARAIVQEAKGKNLTLLPCLDFEAVPGLGVKAVVDGKKIAIGSARFLKECGITIPLGQEQNGGNSSVFVAIDEAFAGLVKVGDELRPSARASLDFLNAQGIRTIIASGDSETAVQEAATALGVTEIFAGLLPAEKTALVKTLQANKNTVVMVGDGINDAPALAQADVGIALSSGTDVAIGTADIVIVSGDIAGVVRAYKVSKAMMENVAQNLALAFAYNIVAIPIASGVLIPVLHVIIDPMIAAAAMSISSVTVILNALRLRALRL